MPKGNEKAEPCAIDCDGKPLARVDLGEDSDPTAIALSGQMILVADLNGPA